MSESINGKGKMIKKLKSKIGFEIEEYEGTKEGLKSMVKTFCDAILKDIDKEY